MTTTSGQTTVVDLLEAVAARTTAPGGGAVAGVVAALAGALAVMSARFADDGRAPVAARAEVLRTKAAALAWSDEDAYAAYVRARRLEVDGRGEVTAALDEVVRVPLEVAEVAAELAELASVLAREGNPNLRGDATAAALLGAAATRAGAVLVCENLAGAGDDPRRTRAATLVASAAAAERAVLSAYPDLLPEQSGAAHQPGRGRPST